MMAREIPRDQWAAFFKRFSRVHADRLVVTEVRTGESAGRIAEGLPLMGITSSMKPYEDSIQVIAGRAKTEDLITHVIPDPSRVVVLEENGREDGVEIEANNGTKTTVRLEQAV